MARPREFDPDIAVGQAMDVFWALGYDSTSLPDLLEGMRLTRGSVYKAFKSKKALFLAVLERYEEEAVADAFAMLTEPAVADGAARIIGLFDAIAKAAQKGDRRGCLLCSAAAGPASYDQDIAKVVHRGLDRIRLGFEQALYQSDVSGMQSDGMRRGMSEVLLTQYVGFRILTRSGHSFDSQTASIKALSRLLHRAD